MDEKALDQFFGAGAYRLKVFANAQEFDYESLKGRVLSSSYMPMEGHPRYEPMLRSCERFLMNINGTGRSTSNTILRCIMDE